MPKVNTVKKARKAIPEHGINVGDTYYWWSFRVGRGSVKRISKTYPKASQLTNSEFMSAFLGLQERSEEIADRFIGGDVGQEDTANDLDELAGEIRSLGEEQEEKRSTMEDAFPNGCPTMELLEQRYSRCEEIADELENAANAVRDEEPEPDTCTECDGEKIVDNFRECETCSGSGHTPVEGSEDPDEEEDCIDCGGAGEISEEETCPRCGGEGEITFETLTETQIESLVDDILAIDWCVE